MKSNDSLITLLRLAQEDQEVFEQLSNILTLESFHRKSALNSLIETMKLNQAPKDILLIMSSLLDDQVATQAKSILESE